MDIQEKIAKLLALATSPNENEAKLALLKARELMAQHKLRPEECKIKSSEEVIRQTIGISVSKTKYKWAVELSAIIAQYYCCVAYRTHKPGAHVSEIGFVGLKEDFEICKRIYEYAFKWAKDRCDEIYSKHAKDDLAYRRNVSESFGFGLTRGIRKALKDQQEAKTQEWGLVMVTPQAVKDNLNGMRSSVFARNNMRYTAAQTYNQMGYDEGMKFNPTRTIENCRNENALRLN